MTTLVIVESPGKLKKIREYLGDGYIVEASVGHIRDLPSRRDQIPEEYRDKPWASLGIDPVSFNPLYIIMPDKEDVVKKLRGTAKKCSRVLFAMDADREGEAIAWHVSRVLRIDNPERIVFTEITKSAIQAAVKSPRKMDMQLVAAQETRRAIDRFVGFGVSPLLWDSVGKNPETGRSASAGRVQSATLMILATREFERMMFTSAQFFMIRCLALTQPPFTTTLTHYRHDKNKNLKDQVIAKESDFGPNGKLKEGHDVYLPSRADAERIRSELDGRSVKVISIEKSEVRSKPPPPFITSSLQQASKKVKMNGKKIMEIAQKLYEGGYITYMRTDSPALSDEALQAARKEIERLYGNAALPDKPRQYAAKSKNAQEAHEAIRPAGTTFRAPEQTDLEGEMLAVYTLIYQRTLASQMLDTIYEKTTCVLGDEDHLLSATGKTLVFAGHTRLSGEEKNDDEQGLPPLTEGQSLTLQSKNLEVKETTPPPRFTDTTIIKAMEASGIGRPSTYAQTIAGLLDRGYVRVLGGDALGVTVYGILNISYLKRQIPDIIAREFTAQMEKELDQIAHGEMNRKAYLTKFYTNGLLPLIEKASKTPPEVTLPHLDGAKLRPTSQGMSMIIGGESTPVSPSLVPGDLTKNDLPALQTGSYQAPQSKDKKSTKSKGSTTRSSTTKKSSSKTSGKYKR